MRVGLRCHAATCEVAECRRKGGNVSGCKFTEFVKSVYSRAELFRASNAHWPQVVEGLHHGDQKLLRLFSLHSKRYSRFAAAMQQCNLRHWLKYFVFSVKFLLVYFVAMLRWLSNVASATAANNFICPASLRTSPPEISNYRGSAPHTFF